MTDDAVTAMARKASRGSIPRQQLDALLDHAGRDFFRRSDGRIDSTRVRKFVHAAARTLRAEERTRASESRRAHEAEGAELREAVDARLQRLATVDLPLASQLAREKQRVIEGSA